MRTVRHPNIVQFLGVCLVAPRSTKEGGTTEERICIITEYLSGGSLESLLSEKAKQKQTLPLSQILSFARDIARALNWLHHKSIIHRDLKPANILLDDRSRCKIADFGLSHVKKRKFLNTSGFYGACGMIASLYINIFSTLFFLAFSFPHIYFISIFILFPFNVSLLLLLLLLLLFSFFL